MRSLRASRPALLAAAALLTMAAGETGPASIEARATGAFGAYLAGRSAVHGGDMLAAAKEFEQALKDDPTAPELNGQAFLAALMAGQDQAAELAKQLPDNPLAQLVLANQDGKAGNWTAARARFEAIRPDPGVNQVLRPLLIAWADYGQRDPDAALATLAPLVDAPRFRAVYALHAGMIADLSGRTALAQRYYGIAIAEYGQINLRVSVIVASWQARSGQLDAARRTIAELANADGEFGISRQGLEANMSRPAVTGAADGIAEAYLAVAAALRQQSEESAQAVVRMALFMRPDLTAARLVLSDIEVAGSRPDSALAALAPIGPTDPLAPMVALRRAALQDAAGHADAALASLETLAREHPDRPEPWAEMGDVFRRQERFADAARAYGEAISKLGTPNRANWQLFYAHGIALERAGQWPKAEADLKFALELAPDQASVLNYLAYSWVERGEHLDEARDMLQRAMKARPNQGAYIDSFGWLLLRQGDIPGAIRELEHAVELEPEDATINGHLGDALAAAGRMREAEFQWRRALNLKPDAEETRRLNEKLAAIPVVPAAAPAAPAR